MKYNHSEVTSGQSRGREESVLYPTIWYLGQLNGEQNEFGEVATRAPNLTPDKYTKTKKN